MIYVFSSAFYELFKQNVLNASCYPDGHVMRLRYDTKYIQPAVKNDPRSIVGQTGLVVFAEGALENEASKADPKKLLRDYTFFPIRACVVSSAEKKADIFILDVRLGNFLDYQDGAQARDGIWDAHIKKSPDRPWPKGFRTDTAEEGYYVFAGDQLPSIQAERDTGVAWRSLVERLNKTELKECITYRVLGFYRRGHDSAEKAIAPKVTGPDAVYRFDSSETVLMKILLFGEANRQRKPKKELRIEFDPKAFTSASSQKIFVNAHYNEERILLPCARTTDPVLTSLSLVQSEPQDGVWSPQPLFVIEVAPKDWYLFWIVVLFALSFLLVNLGKFSELVTGIDWKRPLLLIDYGAKPLGALLFFIASWRYLRKFPLK
jgi:hypothetical protein